MSSFLNGAKLILRNAKKYWFPTLIVLILMISATYLNVQAPKLLGESVENLSTYVYLSTTQKTLDQIDEKIENNQEFDQAFKNEIKDNLFLNDEQKQQLDNASFEQIKAQHQLNTVLQDAVLMDKSYIETNGSFSQEQIDFINNSDLDMMTKLQLTHIPSNQLKEMAKNFEDLDNITDEKHQLFIKTIFKLLTVYISLLLGMALYTIIFVNVTVKTTNNIRSKLFDKIQRLSIRFYDMSNTGDLLSRFTNDIENITMFLNASFIQIMASLCMVGGVGIMMWNEDNSSFELGSFTIQKPLFWAIIVFGLAAVFASSFILKKAQKYVSQQQKKLGILNGFVDESLSGQKEIISYNLKDQMIAKFKEYNNDFKDNAFKGQIYSGLLMPIMMGMGFITIGVIVFVGSDLVIQGIFSVALLVAFMQYSQQFFNNLGSTVAQYNMVELGMSGANRVQEVFDEQEEIKDSSNPIALTNPNSIINFKHVNFEYLKDKPVLKDITFDVNPGEMIAIVGPTGSGKTTIMNLLNRFYDVTSGEICIDNHNIKEYKLDELRKNIGIVLQDSVLFKGTIADNVKFGKDDATKEEIINACKIANIHDYIMSLEEGYDTVISNSSNAFSTGQKQLLSIARTILTNPSILVLDEATSNVDTITEAHIQKAMDEVIKGRTSFVIAHRLKTILKADRILVLKDGKIIESGSHKELLAQDGFYASLYNNQFVD